MGRPDLPREHFVYRPTAPASSCRRHDRPKPHRGGRPPALGPGDLERLAALVREQPDATLEQLKQRGGFECSLKTLWYALDRLDLTFKKKSLHADQRDRPDCGPSVPGSARRPHDRAGKAGFRGRNGGQHDDDAGLRPSALGVVPGGPLGSRLMEDLHGNRGLGAGRGPRPVGVPRVDQHGGVPGVRGTGLGVGTAQGRRRCVRQPQASSGRRGAASIEAAKARVLPLPPYSPDYTPIEEMYSKVKQGLRRAKARTKTRLYDAVGQVLRLVTPHDSLGWFRHAGLCAMPR